MNREAWWFGLELIGGLALFLFGMQSLSRHLERAAGAALRRVLRQASRNRFSGVSVGVLLGFSIQSGPASVMLVGLTHAGLLSLGQAAPVVFGFNVGTTLAMQVLAFNVTDLWPLPLALGLASALVERHRGGHAGMAVAGFGLLLLGLGTMTGSLTALREPLTPWLARMHGETLPATLLGIVVGTAVTGLLFSSAATIGMCLALAAAGVFTDLRQVYPLILGAQLGTCLTSLLAAINANGSGRRTAWLHVGFNLVNVLVGLALMPWLPTLIERVAPLDLPRQIAHLHTALRATTALLLIPFVHTAVELVRRLTPRAGSTPDLSRLEESDLARPEQALLNAVAECRRLARLTVRGLQQAAHLSTAWDPSLARGIVADEAVIDRVKPTFQDYLRQLSKRCLSHRQAILITALNRCIVSIERIQDHIEHLAETIQQAHGDQIASLADEDRERVRELFALAIRVLTAVENSFESDASRQNFDRMAAEIRSQIEAFERFNQACREYFVERAWRKGRGILPSQGLFLDVCANDLEEIVQHADAIAAAQSRSEFFFKTRKQPRVVPPIA